MQEWTRENKQQNPKKQCLPGAGVSGSGEDPKKTELGACAYLGLVPSSAEKLSQKGSTQQKTPGVVLERPQPGGLKKGTRYVSEAS